MPLEEEGVPIMTESASHVENWDIMQTTVIRALLNKARANHGEAGEDRGLEEPQGGPWV